MLRSAYFHKEYTVLFAPKRSTFRFAALTLRVTSHRNDPSGRSGVAHGLFSDSAPTHLRCAGVPLGLFGKPKRSSFSRIRGLRTPHRPPVSSPLAAAAALWLPCVRGAVRRRAGLRGCLRIRVKGKGRRPSPVSAPNRLFKPLWCSGRLIRQAETLDLQPLRGLHRSAPRCLL